MFLNPEKNLLKVGLSESMIVADFDSGSGYYSLACAKLVGNSGKVYSIDSNEELLRRLSNEAKALGIKNIKIIGGNLEKPKGSKLADSLVDLVVIANTFFQIENKENVAKEAGRILRKKGRVLVVDWKDSSAGIGPHRMHLVDKKDVLKIFSEANFSFEKEIDAGDHHFGLIFRVKK